MPSRLKSFSDTSQNAMRQFLAGPQAFVLLPAALLAAFWVGGESLLILLAVALPVLLFCSRMTGQARSARRSDDVGLNMPTGMEVLITELDIQLRQARAKTLKSGCIILSIDDHEEITGRFGHAATQHVAETSLKRLRTVVRGNDKVFLLDDRSLAIAIAPVRQFNLDIGLQLVARLQSALEEPVALDSTVIYLSVSAGFCISSQLKEKTGHSLAHATELAMREARLHAPSAIRSYSSDMKGLQSPPDIASNEVNDALENGQILPWFQPQISTHTGEVTGFEALARWMHPERGIIPPNEFLPLLERGARLERLGEVMLYHALNALTAWDLQGFAVPHVGVNFAPEELRNPSLLEKIEWELDRFNLTPDRLVVEILETVVATSPDDVVTRNINGLSALGCKIDLDDFGTGHASISSIRRFAIGRLKIDRSFVMKVDKDAEQQRMISAILLMAERLGLDTLAEGVESAGEHHMLAQLGCGHVQGFGLARPMPFDKTAAWITGHAAKLEATPMIGRKIG